MNRYLWTAFILLLLLAGAITATVVLDVSDQAAIDLALKAVTTVTGLGTAVFGWLGKRKHTEHHRAVSTPRRENRPIVRHTPLRVMSEEESLSDYLGQLRRRLIELGGEQDKFVTLTTLADADDQSQTADLLPALEWMNRRAGQDFVHAEPERIELVDVPRRFPRAVLLGEPGSGKSTCLQHLVFTELDRLDALVAGGRPGDDEPPLIPLYVTLSDWHDTGLNAEEFLRGQVESLVTPSNFFAHSFDTLLAAGRFLLVLDGLNELPDRKANRREGRHEINDQDGLEALRPRSVGSIDPRERSLRDLAQKMGLRSPFVLSCRSHEYFDSLRWQVIRVLPMNADQVDRFVDTYVGAPTAGELRAELRSNAALASIGTNPFFLRSITRIYRPGLALESRGTILGALLSHVFDREIARKVDASTGDEVVEPFDRPALLRTVGRVAFRMLEAGRIGNQAPLGFLREAELTSVEAIASTGLIVERNGEFFFYHQIVQEFFAAAALRYRAVRRRPVNLLADARWSEVVALWYDLDPDTMHRRVVRALQARNPIWRRPRSFGTAALGVYQMITSLAAILVLGCLLADWMMGPANAVPVLFGLVSVNALIVVGVLLVIRVPWLFVVWNRRVIPNAAYVLALARHPAAVAEIVPALRRLFHLERVQVAKHIARFGPDALPHLVYGLGRRSWRVRAGCVMALGELAYAHPEDPSAADLLVALTTSDDPKLTRSLSESLVRCQDERVPSAVTALIERTRNHNAVAAQFRLQPLGERANRQMTGWSGDVITQLETFTNRDQPIFQRQIALRMLGVLRIPGTERQLNAVASDPMEPMVIRQSAVASLGLMQTAEATDMLLDLAQEADLLQHVANAVRTLWDPVTLPVLAAEVSTSPWQLRTAIATALGLIGTPEALPTLASLAQDWDEDVRVTVAQVLGGIGLADAAPILAGMTRDPAREVRTAAIKSLHENYLDIAAPHLLSLAEDLTYKDRVRLVKILGKRAGPGLADGLRKLTGDPDKAMRTAAQTALQRAQTSKRRAPSWRHPLSALRFGLSRLIQVEGFRELWREERLAGTADGQIYLKVHKRITDDAELSRRYSRLLRVLMYSVMSAYAVLIMLVVVLFRLALWLSHVLLDHWLILVGIVVVALLTRIPALNFHRERAVFAGPTPLNWVVMVTRWLATLALAAFVAGMAVRVWWIWLVLLALIMLVVLLQTRAVHTKHGRRATAAAVAAAQRPTPSPLAVPAPPDLAIAEADQPGTAPA